MSYSNIKSPIIYIEDDEDDQLLIQSASKDLKLTHEILFFSRGDQALAYLQTTPDKPLLVLCDVNLPGMSGLELRQLIDADMELRQKAIPFIFFSTEASDAQINQAYNSPIQGFFIKTSGYEALKSQLELVVRYWQTCAHPNQVVSK
ncbi:response regulator [Larkinella insperata]|uniref:Response regulator n=1 Tax=Larkinella insperata TaxID=332158 RepID=A0ABW3QBD6_9BACT|nr:response regulator [Larkinella insperata]